MSGMRGGMNWKASPPAIERAAVAIASLCLGGALAFAVARMAPWGAGPAAAVCVGAIAALAAWLIVRRVDQQAPRRTFLPQSLDDALVGEDILLLDERIDDDTVLELDQPLRKADGESRVVRLFAGQPIGAATAPVPLAGPSEMIARIEDFLGQGRGATAAPPAPRRADLATDDASAALHAALADIRRSLRQG